MRWLAALSLAGALLLWPGTSASASPLPPEPVADSPSSSAPPSESEPGSESPEVPVVEDVPLDPPPEEPPTETPTEDPTPAVTVVQLSDEDRILIVAGFSLTLLVGTAGAVRTLTK